MLKPKRKIMKQELKKDPVLEKAVEMETFVKDNSKLLFGIIGGIAVIIILSFVMIKSKNKANITASGEFGIAELALSRGDVEDGILRLENIIDTYKKTSGAGTSCILLGQTYLNQSDYENAEIYFNKYIKEYSNDLGLSAAYNGLGVCNENEEKYEKAIENYKKGAKSASLKFQKHQCLVSAARNLVEIQEYAEAKEILDNINNEEPDTQVKSTLEILTAQIAVLEG